ncbi:DMT family transporter [Photobacterium angustum]|uniref:EamA/RhaT family transporter n=1 Tax=Photobacterium angustum TaxID=661 RepID=A0A855S777_PHOAN|nr:DMT family transporter [Photobacterium angustum]KJF83260.1 membrane protein [Photobacterium damselae subsp. damselae]KJG42897.1 membrane protein [Photobacterium angustum]KJG47568.1 membrane protein [Photobacterium angustum]KJG50197.1 membrane protein [Photobacterium angustum]KJG53727.1 membrane protein [Photobacterium angustum]
MKPQYNNMLGAFLIIIATLSLTIKDSADKYLIQHGYHPVQMVFFRFAIPFVFMLIFMPKQTKIAILVTNGKLLIRSAMFLTCAVVSVISLKYIPLEIYIVIVQMSSVAYMLGGAIFFKETLTLPKIIATILGFIGVVVVINPTNVDGLHWVYLLPLLIAATTSGYNLITKTIDSKISLISVLINSFFVLGSVATILLIVQPDIWKTPTLTALPYFLTIPVVTIVSQLCLIKAMNVAEASHVAPFFYFQILFSCVFGYWLFNEIPTTYTIIGALFIVISGLIITYTNYKPNLGKAKKQSVKKLNSAPE